MMVATFVVYPCSASRMRIRSAAARGHYREREVREPRPQETAVMMASGCVAHPRSTPRMRIDRPCRVVVVGEVDVVVVGAVEVVAVVGPELAATRVGVRSVDARDRRNRERAIVIRRSAAVRSHAASKRRGADGLELGWPEAFRNAPRGA